MNRMLKRERIGDNTTIRAYCKGGLAAGSVPSLDLRNLSFPFAAIKPLHGPEDRLLTPIERSFEGDHTPGIERSDGEYELEIIPGPDSLHADRANVARIDQFTSLIERCTVCRDLIPRRIDLFLGKAMPDSLIVPLRLVVAVIIIADTGGRIPAQGEANREFTRQERIG